MNYLLFNSIPMPKQDNHAELFDEYHSLIEKSLVKDTIKQAEHDLYCSKIKYVGEEIIKSEMVEPNITYKIKKSSITFGMLTIVKGKNPKDLFSFDSLWNLQFKHTKLVQFVMNHSPLFHDIMPYLYLTMCFICFYSKKTVDMKSIDVGDDTRKSAKGIKILME